MDNVSSEIRSQIMSKVRSKRNRSTEVRFRAYLIKYGFTGWQVTPKGVDGAPDFMFSEKRVLVFVDGCFWHGCPKCCRMPSSRQEYWTKKIEGNRRRDARISRKLRKAGWKVIRIWEHQIKNNATAALKRLGAAVGHRQKSS